MNWVEGMIPFTIFSFLIFLALNEMNDDLSYELVKPLWFILAISISFGAMISLANCLNAGGRKFD